MSDSTQHIKYTVADIEKYLQGKMTNAERNTFEKAALADPFLADALEGFEMADLSKAKNMLHQTETLIKSSAQQHYNITGIEKYLQGKMTNAERNTFEKAALADPFLADAIEGFEMANLNKAKKYINETASTIKGEKAEQARVITMPFYKQQWFRIAAVIVLFVGAGASVWMMNQKPKLDNNNQLAVINKEEIKQSPTTSSEVETGKTNSTITDKITTETKPATNDIASLDFNTINQGNAAAALHNGDKENKDLSQLNIPSTKEAAIIKSSVGSAPINPAALDSTAQAFKNDNAALADVNANENARTKKTSSVAATTTISANELNNKGITPIGGWKKFDDYINTKRAALHYTGVNVDAVTVTFLIDTNGKPYQVQAQSPIPEKSVRAIELIENGVNWQIKNATNNKAVIVIKL